MDSQSIWIEFQLLLSSFLFKIHSERPVGFCFENKDLEISHIGVNKLGCDIASQVDSLLLLNCMLSKAQRFSKSEHSSRAVVVVSVVISLSQSILVLSCFD